MKFKILKRMLLTSILSLVCGYSFADGGSGISCKNLTKTCPSGQTGSILFSFAATGSFGNCKDVQKRFDSGSLTMSNKNVYITSNTCKTVIVTPTYSYTGYNYTTSACPATQPSGVINMAQSYQVFTDGSIHNYSAWYVTSNTCAAVYQSTETRNQVVSCSAPYPQGAMYQTSSRQIWSDGARGWTSWDTYSNTCYKTVADVKDNTRKTCGEGQTGYRITELRRTHIEYRDDNLTKTPAQQAILNEQNSTAWTEFEVTNTCVNVPDQVATEPGTRLLNCSDVYGGSVNDYNGEVIETGTIVYAYSSVNKQTTKSFKSNNPAIYNSTCSVNNETTESKTETCANGQSGSITSYINVKNITTYDSNKNPVVTKTYPNGPNSWYQVSNTCVENASSSDDSFIVSDNSKSKGLLANNTIKTSSLLTRTDLNTFIQSLDKSTIDINSSYKLHLIVDDLSIGRYNKENVAKTINAFKSVTGKDPIITVPRSLDKYIGNGGMTESNTKTKVLESAVLNNNQVKVTYSELYTGIKESKKHSFTVDLF